MTTRKHSRKKRNQKGIKWFYITAAGLVSAVILAAILFKIRADSADSQRPAGTSVSQKIAGSGDRAGDSPNEENRPDKGNQWNKTNTPHTRHCRNTRWPGLSIFPKTCKTPNSLKP